MSDERENIEQCFIMIRGKYSIMENKAVISFELRWFHAIIIHKSSSTACLSITIYKII